MSTSIFILLYPGSILMSSLCPGSTLMSSLCPWSSLILLLCLLSILRPLSCQISITSTWNSAVLRPESEASSGSSHHASFSDIFRVLITWPSLLLRLPLFPSPLSASLPLPFPSFLPPSSLSFFQPHYSDLLLYLVLQQADTQAAPVSSQGYLEGWVLLSCCNTTSHVSAGKN